MSKKLIKKIEIVGEITLKTGLHIGGTNSAMNIGGIDKAVIRNPLTNMPFIPGSSLKGKMRSLFEVTEKCDLKPIANLENGPAKLGPSAELFGNAAGGKTQRPSRIIVRDCHLVNHEELLKKTDIPYTEGKTEVVIDRITSAANPRQLERVPAGARFSLNMVLNVWDNSDNDENEEKLIGYLFKSLQLLKDDYLGGSGSRGYGQVSFQIKEMKEKTVSGYYNTAAGEAVDVKAKYSEYLNKLNA